MNKGVIKCFPLIWTGDPAFDPTWLSFDPDLKIAKIIILWKFVDISPFMVSYSITHDRIWSFFPLKYWSYCDVVCSLDQKQYVMSIVFSG